MQVAIVTTQHGQRAASGPLAGRAALHRSVAANRRYGVRQVIFLSWTLSLIGKRLIFNRRLTWEEFMGLLQYWRFYRYRLLLANTLQSSRLAIGTL